MSAKAKKPSGRGTPVQRSGTPVQGTSTPIPVRPASPLSPTRHSRLQEKADLQSLNDRLACYIDRVRHLETENSRLTMEVQTSRETVTREVTNIKSIYEHELADARKLLDETAREKAKMEIEAKRIFEENDDLKTKLDRKIKDLIVAENSVRVHESRYNDISGKYNSALGDRKKAMDELKELEKENDRLRKQLEEARKQLEDETLARVDLENNIQSLREELTFKDQVHTQELNETRTRRQIEMNEIDGRLTEKYEVLLQESLQELRDQYENQIRTNRAEIDALYQNKIKNLQNAADRNTNVATSLSEELRMTRTTMDGLQTRIRELEGTNNSLSGRIHELEKLLDGERARHTEDMSVLEAELSRLRDQMAQQLQEYHDLMDIKVSLDLEIAAYDKLLKGEEFRLNITPTSQGGNLSTSIRETIRSSRATPSRRTPSRAGAGSSLAKRKRTVLEESEDRRLNDFSVTSMAKGEIEINEVDPEGRFIKLRNTTGKEVLLGGWQLVRTADGNETTFKFHRSVKIDGDGTVTVWSADTGVTHEPPTNIVMKQQKWFIGDNMKTQLMNVDGDEVAVSERVRRQLSSHASRHRELGGPYGGEELYHQQVRSSQNTSSNVGRSFWLW